MQPVVINATEAKGKINEGGKGQDPKSDHDEELAISQPLHVANTYYAH